MPATGWHWETRRTRPGIILVVLVWLRDEEESLRGGMSEGSMADAKKRRIQFKKQRRKDEASISCWSINAGGLAGLWRAMHMVDDLEVGKRPRILMIQECGCSQDQWLTMLGYMNKRGYTGFVTGCKATGEAARQWHRGCITFIDEALGATLKVEHSWQGGQFHCLEIEDHLWINYYVALCERFMNEQASRLQEQLEKLAWKGPWIMAGDFNETYEGSWVATVAALNGGHMEEFSEDLHATRWDGKRITDLVMTNFQTGGVTTKKEKISDHKILEFEIKLKHLQEIEQRRFMAAESFNRPSWTTPEKWQQCFDEAFQCGQREEWVQAFHWAAQFREWPEEDESGQEAIELVWTVACAQMTWCFMMASRFALWQIPKDFEDANEMRKVMKMANKNKIKGCEVKTQLRRRSMKYDCNLEMERKRCKKIGRLRSWRSS